MNLLESSLHIKCRRSRASSVRSFVSLCFESSASDLQLQQLQNDASDFFNAVTASTFARTHFYLVVNESSWWQEKVHRGRIDLMMDFPIRQYGTTVSNSNFDRMAIMSFSI